MISSISSPDLRFSCVTFACPSRIRCQAATGSWTKSRQWETQRTLFSSARATMWPPAKVDGVWPFNDAWLRTSLSEARRQAPRHVASILDSARKLGIRDAHPCRKANTGVAVIHLTIVTAIHDDEPVGAAPCVARGQQRSANWATAVALLLTFATACGDGPPTPTGPTTPTAPTSPTNSVEEPGFTLSGTVSDGRRNGPLLAGAVVRLENGQRESTTTGPDGRYRFLNVQGTVTVTVTAEHSYVTDTVEVTMDADRTLDFDLEHTGTPPYGGTVSITPRVIEPSDPTTLGSITYAGRGQRYVYDRRPDAWITIDVYLFNARYAGQEVEFRVNSEFGSEEAAQAEVETYAPALGQMPAVLRSGTTHVVIHAGNEPWGGGLIHADRGKEYIRRGIMEEVLVHEAAHNALDIAHKDSPGWRAAQAADGVFISEYARDYPDREDIAESILPYFAVRYRTERLTEADRSAILAAIPNRLVYFDEQGFDMSPYTRGSTTRILGLRPFQPRRIWQPFEGPPIR